MRSNLNDLVDDHGTVFWWRLFLFVAALLVVTATLTVVSRFLGWGIGWSTLPAQKYSVENVEREYGWFYGMHQQIRANRLTVSALETKQTALREINGADTTRWAASVRDEYAQVTQQILQMQTVVNVACGEYQARWRNVFHAMAAPGDIPRTCEGIR